jgi:hypothetical protein
LLLKEELGLETRGPVEYITSGLGAGLGFNKRHRAGRRAQKRKNFPPSQILDHTQDQVFGKADLKQMCSKGGLSTIDWKRKYKINLKKLKVEIENEVKSEFK